MTFPVIRDSAIKQLSRLLAENSTGSDISDMFSSLSLEDCTGESTKWKRLYGTWQALQQRHQHADDVVKCIEYLLDPVHFVDEHAEYDQLRSATNKILAFAGLKCETNGKVERVPHAQTLDEAAAFAERVLQRSEHRSLHPEVRRHCAAEMFANDPMHAIFEATKGFAQRLRDLSGVDADGADLVGQVFGGDDPKLKLSARDTRTEKGEHRGYMMLAKGCFMAVRNPVAHVHREHWQGEEDVADHFALLSLLHRRLDRFAEAPASPAASAAPARKASTSASKKAFP